MRGQIRSRRRASNVEAPLRIWLADDDAYCCEHLTWLLTAETRGECLRSFSSVADLLASLRQETPPDAILVSAKAPFMNDVEIIHPIKHLAPSAVVFVLSVFYDNRLQEQALAAGAAGLLLKRYSQTHIASIIRATVRSAQTSSHNNCGKDSQPSEWTRMPSSMALTKQ